MANLLFRHTFERFGRRWRIDIATADESYAPPTVVVELPFNAIVAEPFEWKCGFDHIPVGLPSAPTLTLTFDLEALGGTSKSVQLGYIGQLQHLHDRLINPYIKPAAQVVAVINHDGYSFFNEQGIEITIDPWTETVYEPSDAIPLLTNVVYLYSDRGESTLVPQDFFLESVFAQALSVEPVNVDVRSNTITIEFAHLVKFVLEQVDATSVMALLRNTLPVQNRTNQLFHHVWTYSGKKFWIESQIEDIETDKRIEMVQAAEVYAAINSRAGTLAGRITRGVITSIDVDEAYLPYCRFFKQNPNNPYPDGASVGSYLNVLTPLHIGQASESEEAFTAGGLATGGLIKESETIFDFVLQEYEAGVIGRYVNNGVEAYRLAGRGTLLQSGLTITASNAEITDKIEFGRNLIRASELNADGQPVRAKSGGQTRGQTDWSGKFQFHNHAFDTGEIEQPESKFYRSSKFLEGKLYYVESQFDTSEPLPYVAVLPKIEFEVAFDTWFSIPFTSSNFPIWVANDNTDEETTQNALAEYAASVNASNGIAKTIGEAITAFYSPITGVTLSFKTHIGKFAILPNNSQCLPIHVGQRLSVDWNDIVAPRLADRLPTSGILLESTFDFHTGVISAKALFHNPPEGITFSTNTGAK